MFLCHNDTSNTKAPGPAITGAYWGLLGIHPRHAWGRLDKTAKMAVLNRIPPFMRGARHIFSGAKLRR